MGGDDYGDRNHRNCCLVLCVSARWALETIYARLPVLVSAETHLDKTLDIVPTDGQKEIRVDDENVERATHVARAH